MNLPQLKLVSFRLCPYVHIDLDNPPEWFHDVSPLEKVPVLLVDEQPLFESMVICEYLDEITPGSLYPADPFKKARNRAWIEFGNDLLGVIYSYFTTDNELTFKQSIMTIKDRLETLQDNFNDGPYFNGAEFSLVDAVYAPIFRNLTCLESMHNRDLFEDAPTIAKWRDALLQRDSVSKAVPETFTADYCAYVKRTGSVFSQQL